jgi:hypothetical protein
MVIMTRVRSMMARLLAMPPMRWYLRDRERKRLGLCERVKFNIVGDTGLIRNLMKGTMPWL